MNPFISSLHHYLRHARGKGPYTASLPEGRAPGPKHYERMESMILPPAHALDMSLSDALRKRKTRRAFTDTRLALADISSLLFHGAHHSDATRPYPSGGMCYPVEVYMITMHVEGLKKSVLHYEPKTHTLRRLWEISKDVDADDLITIGEDAVQSPPGALIVLTAVWNRTGERYKDFAYILSLLECGHIGQNLCLVGEALALSVCPLGGFEDEKITTLLDLDPLHEQPVYVLAIGKTKQT